EALPDLRVDAMGRRQAVATGNEVVFVVQEVEHAALDHVLQVGIGQQHGGFSFSAGGLAAQQQGVDSRGTLTGGLDLQRIDFDFLGIATQTGGGVGKSGDGLAGGIDIGLGAAAEAVQQREG